MRCVSGAGSSRCSRRSPARSPARWAGASWWSTCTGRRSTTSRCASYTARRRLGGPRLLGTTNPRAAWEEMLDPRFARHGAYLVRSEDHAWNDEMVSWVPEASAGHRARGLAPRGRALRAAARRGRRAARRALARRAAVGPPARRRRARRARRGRRPRGAGDRARPGRARRPTATASRSSICCASPPASPAACAPRTRWPRYARRSATRWASTRSARCSPRAPRDVLVPRAWVGWHDAEIARFPHPPLAQMARAARPRARDRGLRAAGPRARPRADPRAPQDPLRLGHRRPRPAGLARPLADRVASRPRRRDHRRDLGRRPQRPPPPHHRAPPGAAGLRQPGRRGDRGDAPPRRHAPPRRARPAHRPAQPPRLRAARGRTRAARGRWRCSSATSTTSSASTTRSDHEAGDAVLRRFASVLRAAMRDDDTADAAGRRGVRRRPAAHRRRRRPRAPPSACAAACARSFADFPAGDLGVASAWPRSSAEVDTRRRPDARRQPGALRRQAPRPRPLRAATRPQTIALLDDLRGARHRPARRGDARSPRRSTCATRAPPGTPRPSVACCESIARGARLVAPTASSACTPAGVLHDIGKLGIADAILHKPGAARRRASGRRSAATPRWARASSSTPTCADIADWVLHHHERIDGRGYPDRPGGRRDPARGAHPRRSPTPSRR